MKPISSHRPALPGLADIAREAGVSMATASLAMNNHARVTARTQLRVVEAAARLGYVPNQAARRLARERFGSRIAAMDQIGFVLFDYSAPELDGPYLSMLRGVEYQASQSEAALVFLRIGADRDRDKASRLLKAGGVDGWLAVGKVGDEALGLIGARKTAVVVVGDHLCRRPVHQVNIRFEEAGWLAVQHLAVQRHRRIGFVGGSLRLPYQKEILAGFRNALKEFGCDEAEDLVQVVSDEASRPFVERLRRLLAVRPAPTAIFMSESGYAGRLKELGPEFKDSLPAANAVVGCELDNVADDATHFPRVKCPFREVGRSAVSLLQEVARQPDVPPRQVRVSPVLLTETVSAGAAEGNKSEGC